MCGAIYKSHKTCLKMVKTSRSFVNCLLNDNSLQYSKHLEQSYFHQSQSLWGQKRECSRERGGYSASRRQLVTASESSRSILLQAREQIIIPAFSDSDYWVSEWIFIINIQIMTTVYLNDYSLLTWCLWLIINCLQVLLITFEW